MQLRRIPSFRLLLAGALATATFAAAPAAAQVRPDSAARAVQPLVAADSVALDVVPDPAGVFLGYVRITPNPFRLGGRRLAEERLAWHWTDLSGRWWRSVEARLDATRDTMWRDVHGLLRRPGDRVQHVAVASDTVRYLPVEEEPDTTPTVASFLPGGMGQYADLGMLVTGRGEMGSAWQRFEPCNASGFNSCEQGLRPRLRPDLQFGVLLGGTITDRVHLSVDYDQAREFDAANNINVYYQGLEDEILQRFEMGDVSITMPQSQYLTGGVPGGNFGFRALAQVGPLELQSVWAQQQGDIGSVELNVDARTGSQYSDNRITLDDHAYVSGRFFFVVDPAELPGYPHIDALALRPSSGGATTRPAQGTLQLYRDELLSSAEHEASRVFLGRAVSPSGTTVVPGHFRRLDPTDYVLHSSGLWVMLRQPLGRDEVLAMSYVTEAGDTVGTMDATAEPGATLEDAPELRLLRGPLAEHHPATETWAYEMHQVYQAYSGNLEPSDLELQIKLGDATQGQNFVTYQGAQIQLLRLFGLDVQSPEQQLDAAFVFRPSEQEAGTTVTGTFIVFPTLRPFADPPGTPGLSAADADAALGSEANHRIYEERDPDLRATARFRLLLDYRVRNDGLISEFSLGGFGVREGSERIQLDGVTLRRGTDYTVDYTTGTIRLSNPQQLFAGRTSPRLSATFEQNSLFQIATKSIFGTTARWRLGETGEVNLVGLYQNERSVMTRPELGNEPNSIMMGGLTTDLLFQTNWMDRMLDAIPGLRLAGESSIGLTGEVAMSLPDPNTRGLAYLDDFEATSEISIGMSQYAWRLGSRPGLTTGAAGVLPMVMDENNVFNLVWQHQAFDRSGATFGAFSTTAVDTSIATAGREIPEPVLYVTMREDETIPRGERVWRSMTTVLSARGTDLTTSEFLEFYAQENSSDVAIVLDIGTVSEDAFFVDSLGEVNGVHPVTGEEWGLGILDQEAGFNQPWGTDIDFGIWDEGCNTTPGALFLLGSRNANCTVGNGRNDTEDLNGDGVPDLEDRAYFRYTIPLGPGSPYLVRDRAETGTVFRLYRVPLRGPNALPLNGADGETWRNIRHMRMTIASGNCAGEIPPGRPGAGDPLCLEGLLFSRMRFMGARWRKREVEGVIAGLVGREPVPGDHSMNVRVGPVSQVTDGVAYLGPPGTGNQASDPSATFGGSGVEVNEKALRIGVTDLEPDARAEVFYRFPQETRSFMQYRELRLWALPRAGDWGPDGTMSLLVKVGTDDGNYYMYRTRLRPPIENRNVNTRAYWLPEVVIDFEEWFRLKAEAETAAVQAGVGDTAIWNQDSTYAIVLSSRAQSPNLAAIRELTLAVHNGSGLPADSAELWVNDLRLGNGRTDAGFAGVVALDARAADFATVRLSVANQGAFFHPMNRDATLEGNNQLGVSGRFEAGHFAPAGWGLAMPVTVQHNRQDLAPAFLSRSDIRASNLEGLRESGSATTAVGLSVAKTTPAANPWLGLVVDGARLSLNWRNASRDAFTQSSETSNLTGAVDYQHSLQPRVIDVTPNFLVGVLRALVPAAIERSGFFERVSSANLRWSPSTVGFSTSYMNRDSKTYNYGTVLAGPGDALIDPIESPERDLQNSASIGFLPFESLNAQFTVRSARDLLSPEELDDPLAQQAVRDEIASPGGFDLGWEKSRGIGGNVNFQPRIAAWLRPSVTWSSEYTTTRDPHYLSIVEVGEDTTASMQRDFGIDARLERRLYFDPAGLLTAAWGTPDPEAGLMRRTMRRAGGALLPIDFTWRVERASRFDRSNEEPGYGYRFGLGELDELRLVAGDTAGTATERVGYQARGGVRLPLGLQLDLSYADNDRHSISGQGGNNDVRDRTWPDVRLGVSALPLPEFVKGVVARASASTGYRIEESEQAFGNALRTRRTRSVPLQGTATFTNGLNATYTGALGRSRGLETTGRTRGQDAVHGVQLSATFDAPESLGQQFDQPITASLGFNYSSRSMCEVSGLGTAVGDTIAARCAPRYDSLDRDVHVTLETMLNDLNLGVQFSLNDRQSFVGLRDGAREFRLAIFANFNFGVGVLPAGLGQGRMGY